MENIKKELVKKEFKQIDNTQYKDRFQFILEVNANGINNIVCQRYFRINGFSYDALESVEMIDTMNEVVGMIQRDLVSKSRIYDWYNYPSTIKLTGFVNTDDLEKYTPQERMRILCGDKDMEIVCENGDIINKTYLHYPKEMVDSYNENEKSEDEYFLFTFKFLVDDHVVYERQWDGNTYHKMVKNSVDLSNSDSIYREADQLTLNTYLSLVKAMNSDKVDLIYHIIKKICHTLSSHSTDKTEYTKKITFYSNSDAEGDASDDKTYYCTNYNKKYVNNWRSAVEEKTKEYFKSIIPSDGQCAHIDRYL